MRRVGQTTWAGAVLTLALLMAATAAQARVTTIAVKTIPASGPVLAGRDVVWAAQAPDLGLDLFSRELSERAPRRKSFTNSDPRFRLDGRLSASDDLVALTLIRRPRPCSDRGCETPQPDAETFVARSGAAFESISSRCTLPDPITPIDVDASVVVFPGSDCGRSTALDVTTGAQRPLPGTRRGLRVAGRYLAWLDGPYPGVGESDELVVYDRIDGREAFRLRRAQIRGDVLSFDLDADGVVVLSYRRGVAAGGQPAYTVGWASPSEPRLHRLPLKPSDYYGVRVAEGRVVFVRGSARGTLPFLRVPEGELGTIRLSDARGRVVARNADDAYFVERFDFDGKRMTWSGPSCSGPRIYVAELGDALPALRCKLRLRSGPRLVGRTLSVDVDCGALVGCRLSRTAAYTSAGELVGRSARASNGTRIQVHLRRGATLRPRQRVNLRTEIIDAEGHRLPHRTVARVR